MRMCPRRIIAVGGGELPFPPPLTHGGVNFAQSEHSQTQKPMNTACRWGKEVFRRSETTDSQALPHSATTSNRRRLASLGRATRKSITNLFGPIS